MGRQHQIARQAASPLPSNGKVSAAALSLSHTQTSFSGPIPHPDVLAGYDKVVPGLAVKIVEMANRQGEHRMGMETAALHGENFRATAGLVCGFVLTLAMIACGTYVVLNGHDAAGAAIGGTGVAGIVITFITGTSSRRKERAEKARTQAMISR